MIELAGELDLSTIPKIEGRLFRALRSHSTVVIDLARLSFIDSSGINLLIQAHKAEDAGDLHIVVQDGSQVERVFAIAGIDRALSVFSDRNEAISALAPPRKASKGRTAA